MLIVADPWPNARQNTEHRFPPTPFSAVAFFSIDRRSGLIDDSYKELVRMVQSRNGQNLIILLEFRFFFTRQ